MTLTLALLLQAPAPTGGGGFGALAPFLFQVVAIFGIFYFIMIRPQQRQRRQHEERLRNLKRGDEVVTSGGLVGEVVHIKDGVGKDGQPAKSMDDRITIKSGDSRLIVERGRIARVSSAEGTTSAPPTAANR
jgi:preprotein translocase subunit YajC